jgi:phage terminase small subunit
MSRVPGGTRSINKLALQAARQKMTPMEQLFADAMLSGKTGVKAAEVAGYADPKGSVEAILARPYVSYYIIENMRPATATWRLLALKVKRWLNTALDGSFEVKVRDGDEESTQTIIVRPSERTKACEVIVNYLSKAGMGALMEEAEKQDQKEGDVQALARAAMSTKVPGSESEQ